MPYKRPDPKEVIEKLKFMDYAPVMFISAKSGQRVNTVFGKVKEVFETARRRITITALVLVNMLFISFPRYFPYPRPDHSRASNIISEYSPLPSGSGPHIPYPSML